MKDLDELLTDDGRAWQAPPAAEPDLTAALARSAARRGRVGAGATLVVLVALATGGALFFKGAPVPATPAPMTTQSASSTPASTAEATPPPSPEPTAHATDPAEGRTLHTPPTRQELAEVVHDNAVQRGIPAEVGAVRTTLKDAGTLIGIEVGGWPESTAVWLVQVRGEFSCGPCTPIQTGPEAGVGVLTLILKTADLQQIVVNMGDATHDLAKLGTVVTLDPEATR